MIAGISLGDVWEGFIASPPWYLATVGFVLGGLLSSFLGVVVYRIPRGLGLGGRSVCVCGRQLKAYENVPVFAWIFLRGKTRCCGERIPFYLFAYEIVSSLALMSAGFLGLGYLGAGTALFVALIVVLVIVFKVSFLRKKKSGVQYL